MQNRYRTRSEIHYAGADAIYCKIIIDQGWISMRDKMKEKNSKLDDSQFKDNAKKKKRKKRKLVGERS